MHSSSSLDENILKELIPWREQYQNKSQQSIAVTDVTLDHTNCWYAECVMGDTVADSYRNSYRKTNNNTTSAIAFAQAGGIRATVRKGREYE